jgi:hypothetical protein
MYEIQHQQGGERAHQQDPGGVSSCILPSLNSKAVLQGVRLLFLLRQDFYGREYFPRR